MVSRLAAICSSRPFWLGQYTLDSVHWGLLQKVAMSVDIQIETLSLAEKVQLLESVWQSLCAHPCDVRSPDWHREVLDERRRRLEDGLATISAWHDAKARLMQLGR